MKRILVISPTIPMPDRASGDLRFHGLLKQLSRSYQVDFFSFDNHWQAGEISAGSMQQYSNALCALGINPQPELVPCLRRNVYDIVLFEFYYAASAFLKLVRFHQPGARMIIDSVDVHYTRLRAKAELTSNNKDLLQADDVRKRELAAYRASDGVIAVSQKDGGILRDEIPGLPVNIIPNIHRVPAMPARRDETAGHNMVFVGGFRHEPNVDAMLYFCEEVLPLIRQDIPDATLTIIGSSPPDEILALAGEAVRVMGFVPDTTPFLNEANVSIAPLRYGGGLKGKVGEALSHGLPVVTTRFGIEGYDLTPGVNVLIGDTAAEFANHVTGLFKDNALRRSIGQAGNAYMRENFSSDTIMRNIDDCFHYFASVPVRKLPLLSRTLMNLRGFTDSYILWRFSR